jgi:purine-binding chemotaxis protein CheW
MGGLEPIAGGLREGGSFLDTSNPEIKPEQTLAFVALRLGGESFALQIEKVREIIRVPRITWVPGAPESVSGVINLRGTVIAVVDPAVVLSLPAAVASDQNRVVIVEAKGNTIGFLVDSVIGVADIPAASLEPALRTLSDAQRSCLVAQAGIDGKLVGILDVDRIAVRAQPQENQQEIPVRGS